MPIMGNERPRWLLDDVVVMTEQQKAAGIVLTAVFHDSYESTARYGSAGVQIPVICQRQQRAV